MPTILQSWVAKCECLSWSTGPDRWGHF